MKEYILKYKTHIAISILIILSIILNVNSCSNREQSVLEGNNQVIKDKVKTAKDGILLADKRLMFVKDSLLKDNIEKGNIEKELLRRLKESQEQIKKLSYEVGENKKRIVSLTNKEVAKELNTVYNSTKAVVTDQGVELQGNLPVQVLETITEVNYYQGVVVEKDKQLLLKDSLIINKDGELKNANILFKTAEKSLHFEKVLTETQEDQIKVLESQNKSLKNKKWFDKYIVKPLIFTGGAFIGSQIIK